MSVHVFYHLLTPADSCVTPSPVNLRNGSSIKPLNGINNVTAGKLPVISTTNKTDCAVSNGNGYDENDLVSSSVIKPHNGFVRQCSKSNGCSEFETQSNRLNTFYSQMSAKNGFNHSTVSIINPKKSVNGTTKMAANESHIEPNNVPKSNGSSAIENSLVNEMASINRIVSNGNGVSTISHDDDVDVAIVSNGNANHKGKATTTGRTLFYIRNRPVCREIVDAGDDILR